MFRTSNLDAHFVETSFFIDAQHIKTGRKSKTITPILVFNRKNLIEIPQGRQAIVFNGIRAVILTAIRTQGSTVTSKGYGLGKEKEGGGGAYGVRVVGNPLFTGTWYLLCRAICSETCVFPPLALGLVIDLDRSSTRTLDYPLIFKALCQATRLEIITEKRSCVCT